MSGQIPAESKLTNNLGNDTPSECITDECVTVEALLDKLTNVLVPANKSVNPIEQLYFYSLFVGSQSFTQELYDADEIAGQLRMMEGVTYLTSASRQLRCRYKLSRDEAFFWMIINNGEQKDDPAQNIRIYLNIECAFIPEFFELYPAMIIDSNVNVSIKTELKPPNVKRVDSVVIYCHHSDLRFLVAPLARWQASLEKQTERRLFLPIDPWIQVLKPATINGNPSPLLAIAQNPSRLFAKEKVSVNRRMEKALKTALQEGYEQGVVSISYIYNNYAQIAIDASAFHNIAAVTRSIFRDYDINPDKLYMNNSASDEIAKNIDQNF